MTGEFGLAAPMGPAVHNQLMAARKLGFEDGLVGHLVAAALKLNWMTRLTSSPRKRGPRTRAAGDGQSCCGVLAGSPLRSVRDDG